VDLHHVDGRGLDPRAGPTNDPLRGVGGDQQLDWMPHVFGSDQAKGDVVGEQRRSFVSSIMVCLLIASGLFVILPATPAFAACPNNKANLSMYQASQFFRGVKVTSMTTHDRNNPGSSADGSTNVQCARVSSLDMYNDGGHQMEIGWYIVPPAGGEQPVCPVDTNQPQQPVFLIIKTSPTGQFCRYSGTKVLTPGTTHSYKESDVNLDGNWSFWFDGNPIGMATSTSDWTAGWAATNGEQHSSQGDSAYSNFNGMQFVSDAGPHDWTQAGLFCDSSTTYDTFANGSVTDIAVRQGSGGTAGRICS
jgi:hypothetical protein